MVGSSPSPARSRKKAVPTPPELARLLDPAAVPDHEARSADLSRCTADFSCTPRARWRSTGTARWMRTHTSSSNSDRTTVLACAVSPMTAGRASPPGLSSWRADSVSTIDECATGDSGVTGPHSNARPDGAWRTSWRPRSIRHPSPIAIPDNRRRARARERTPWSCARRPVVAGALAAHAAIQGRGIGSPDRPAARVPYPVPRVPTLERDSLRVAQAIAGQGHRRISAMKMQPREQSVQECPFNGAWPYPFPGLR